MAEDKEAEKTIAEQDVVTKYKFSGDIVNRVLKTIIAKCEVGASIREICEFGDSQLIEETGKIFKKSKDLKKGIAFPTCISVNNCICHFSPLKSEPDYLIQDEDVIKIDLGAHVDGFIAVVAHTLVVGATSSKKITGRKADVILAAHYASQVALSLLRPGNETYAITKAVQQASEAFKCKPVEGMLSHQLKQFQIDGDKTIIQNPNDAQRKEHEKYDIEQYEVYAMDVLVSTGEGVGREGETKVSIYKKTDEIYQLKLKASRTFFVEVRNRFGNMPFNLRGFGEDAKSKMGLIECVSHKLIEPFQVLYEKPNEIVAHFKYTALLMHDKTIRITGVPFDASQYESEHKITDQSILDLLAASPDAQKTNKKRNKQKSQSENATTDGSVKPMEVDGGGDDKTKQTSMETD